MMMGSVFRAVRTWPAVLLSVLFLALPLQRVAANQETAPAPLIEFTVQTGHTAEIQGLEYAADGRFFVSAGKDSAIKLWSPEGTLIRTIRTGFWVNYLVLSHDGKLLLAASRTGNVFLLSLDGRVVHRFPDIPLREKFVSAVAMSDDNRNVAVGTTKGVVLYRFENGVGTPGPSLEAPQGIARLFIVLIIMYDAVHRRPGGKRKTSGTHPDSVYPTLNWFLRADFASDL